MNVVSILRFINIILAAFSLPPTILLMKHLIEEGKAVAPGVRIVNKVLINSFILFSVAGLANAILSLLLFMGINFTDLLSSAGARGLFNIRDMLVNIGYLCVSWGLWFTVFWAKKKEEVKKNNDNKS